MVQKIRLIIFLIFFFLSFGSPAKAKTCKTKSAAADFKCKISGSKNALNLKYRYLKSDRRSVSIDYLKDLKGPYARESFIVKIDPSNPQKEKGSNCLLFGMIGKCIRKKLKVCDSILTASSSETYGLFNNYKYKRSLSFNIKDKSGVYSYYRKTPKASSEHQLDIFEVEFDRCKLIKEY